MIETLEALALKRLEDGPTPVRLPRNWNSIRVYERLIEKGIAIEVAEANPLLRSFKLADHGQTEK